MSSTPSAAPLFDTHAHLDFPGLAEDLDGLLARARAAGVTRIVSIGAGRGPGTLDGALTIARRHPGVVWATVGVHPHDASGLAPAVIDALESLAADPQVVALGETGLDFHYDRSPRDAQRDAFRAQIALARRVGKPIVVHTRLASDETLAILQEERARDVGGIIHCFSEDAAFAARALDLGFVASFSGLVTFPRAGAIREAALKQPLDAILVETDAPFLAPVPLRGRRAEPAHVAYTADAIAAWRGIAPEQFRRITTANGCRVYGLPDPSTDTRSPRDP